MLLPIPIFYRNLKGIYKACNLAQEKYWDYPNHRSSGKTVFLTSNLSRLPKSMPQRDQELLDSPGDQIYEANFVMQQELCMTLSLTKR